MALSPRLLPWVLLCAYYWSVTATEAHLAPHRRQFVVGRPSFYRPLSVPTQSVDVARPTGSFDRSKGPFDSFKGSLDGSAGSFVGSTGSFDSSTRSFDSSTGWSFDTSKGSFDSSKGTFDGSTRSFDSSTGWAFDSSKGSFDASMGSFDRSTEPFDTPVESNGMTESVNVADTAGGFFQLSNTEGEGSTVELVSKTDGSDNTLLQTHTADSALDHGNQAIVDFANTHSYEVDTGIISGNTDDAEVEVTGHSLASAVNAVQSFGGDSNVFKSYFLNLFQSAGSTGESPAARVTRRGVEDSRHGRRYLRKVRYPKERRQDLLGVGNGLVDLGLVGGALDSTASPASSSPSTANSPSTVNDPNFEASSGAPATPEAGSTSGALPGDSSGSQSAPVAASPGVGGSNSQTSSASSVSPASPLVGADADSQGPVNAASSSPPAVTDSGGGGTLSAPSNSSPAADESSASEPVPPSSADSADSSSESTTQVSASRVNAGDAASDSPGSATESTEPSGADSDDRGSSSTEAQAVQALSSATGGTGTTMRKAGKSPRQLSRSRRGFISLKAGPGSPPTSRQLYHPRRGSEYRREGLSPRYMRRTRRHDYDRRQEGTVLPSRVDGDLDSDTNSLDGGLSNGAVPADDVSSSLGNLFRRYLPSWMDFTKRQDDAILQADEEVDQDEKDVDDDVAADIPDDGARSFARRFYAKVGTVKRRQDAAIVEADEAADRDADALDDDVTADVPEAPSTRRDLLKPRQDAAIVDADEAADRDADALDNDVTSDVATPPNSRRALPHPKVHMTGTNIRRQDYEKISSDPDRFEEEWLDYARRALPHPKGTISYNHRRDGTGQWAVSSGGNSHLSLSRRYPPSFRTRRQETITDVNDDVERDEQDVDGDIASDVPAPAESTATTPAPADRRRQETVTEVNDDVEADEEDVDTDLAADEPHPTSSSGRSFAGPAVPHPRVSVTNLNGTRPAFRRQEREDGVTDDLTGLLGNGISVPPDNLSAEIPPSLGASKSSAAPAATPTPTGGASNTTTEDDLSAPDIQARSHGG